MSKSENCMFLRECKCLRPTAGICNKCGKSTKYSEQEKVWYCDCECNTKTCALDRNPDKKYFKVEATENLFNEFKNLSYNISDMAAIVQNDMIIDMEELKEWLATAANNQKKFSDLVKEVTTEILKKQVKK